MSDLHGPISAVICAILLIGSSAHAAIACRGDGALESPSARAGDWVGRTRAELDDCLRRNRAFEVSKVEGDPLATFLRLRDQLDACERGQGSAPRTEKLTLDYDLAGPNRALRSGNYSVIKLQKLIALALSAGVDPYLAIALALLENPPLADASSVQGYEYGFGDLPLDAFPLFDALGCLSRGRTSLVEAAEWSEARRLYARTIAPEPSREFSQMRDQLRSQPGYVMDDTRTFADVIAEGGCPPGVERFCTLDFRRGLQLEREQGAASDEYEQFLKRLPLAKQIEVRSRLEKQRTAFVIPSDRVREVRPPWAAADAKPVYMCASPGPLDPGVPAWFVARADADPALCCARVPGLAGVFGASKELRNAMALANIVARIRVRPGALASLAHDVQAFNGRGRLGVTESVDNRCFSGLDMRTHPFYGARVLDLMLNTLMSNPRLAELVEQASVEFSRPLRSVFCQKLGPGRHQVAPSTFLDLQRSYLLGGEGWRRQACLGRFR